MPLLKPLLAFSTVTRNMQLVHLDRPTIRILETSLQITWPPEMDSTSFLMLKRSTGKRFCRLSSEICFNEDAKQRDFRASSVFCTTLTCLNSSVFVRSTLNTATHYDSVTLQPDRQYFDHVFCSQWFCWKVTLSILTNFTLNMCCTA